MNFDFLAPHYRWIEFFAAGPLLQRGRVVFLKQARDARRILILGEGNGRFLAELLRVNSAASVTVLDASARMLELARRRVQAHGLSNQRIRFVHQDINVWPGHSERFDLVVTHFFLDGFPPEQLKNIVQKIAANTSANAHWLLADFRRPEHGWRRMRANAILQLLYCFFRLTTRLPARHLTDPQPALEANGFSLANRVIYDCGLLHSDVWVKTMVQHDLAA
jgi:SAM-dependent methyltransferase